MQTFNFNRFFHTLLYQAVSNRKTSLNYIAFGLLFAICGGLMTLATSFHSISPGYAQSIASIFFCFFIAYMLTFGTLIVSNITDKKQRINAFILPASKLEKFVSRYAYLLVVVPLLAFTGLLVGDLVQMLVLKIVAGDAYSVIASLFGNAVTDSFHTENEVISFFALWQVHSFLLLLGTCFHRHAWVKSVLVAVAITIAITLAIIVGAKEILDFIYGEGNYTVVLIDEPWVTVATCTGLFAVTAFNYWASFRIYRRMQAINNKWYNF